MLKVIYVALLIIVTIWTLYLYLQNDEDYRNELKRISIIENRLRKKKDFINYHRLNSIPCNIPNLNNPRDCYLGSNYICRWSEYADRCNQIE